MTTIDFNTSVQIPEAVLFKQLEDEAVLLNVETGFYFSLDPVGAHIWRLLTEGGRLDLIFSVLLEEYDVEDERLEKDLLDLVEKLVDNQLLEIL